jgi:hypothetical protein
MTYRDGSVWRSGYRADEQLAPETKAVLCAIMNEPPTLAEDDPPAEMWARVIANLTQAGYFGPVRF